MCEYSGIDDPQCYTKEELSSEEIECRICNIIKVGRDEKLELKIPMYENGNCPVVSAFLFRYDRLFLWTCRWISCRKNTGYHATDPNIRT
jgi:hypothetical protein